MTRIADLNQDARRAIILAQEEARQMGHAYIGTEHMLLGLLNNGEGLAADALEAMGVTLWDVREKVVETIGTSPGTVPGHYPFTPRLKKILTSDLGDPPDWGILDAIRREGQGVAATILAAFNKP